MRIQDQQLMGQMRSLAPKKTSLTTDQLQHNFSRYIGAVGIESFALQANSKVLLVGLDPLGLEIAKNIILSGVKKFGIFETRQVKELRFGLQGMFLLHPSDDLNQKIVDLALPRLQDLNQTIDLEVEQKLSSLVLSSYDVIILCNQTEKVIFSEEIQKSEKPIVLADTFGLFGRVVNSFGQDFKVLDLDGEEVEKGTI